LTALTELDPVLVSGAVGFIGMHMAGRLFDAVRHYVTTYLDRVDRYR
jgi:nucleoside-diphosphate-sugar epimerase